MRRRPNNGQSLDGSEPFLPRFESALALLLQAWDYAEKSQEDVWEFAEEIARVRDAGLSNADIRWLLKKSMIVHAEEISRRKDNRRRFVKIERLSLPERTCVVLTAHGEMLARNMVSTWRVGQAAHEASSVMEFVLAKLTPHWDKDRMELRLGKYLVKRYRQPAKNQETILAAFEEESWPPRIDRPLPGDSDTDPHDRLHDAVKRLNQQIQPLIRFQSDGKGEGVCWTPLAPAAPQERPLT